MTEMQLFDLAGFLFFVVVVLVHKDGPLGIFARFRLIVGKPAQCNVCLPVYALALVGAALWLFPGVALLIRWLAALGYTYLFLGLIGKLNLDN